MDPYNVIWTSQSKNSGESMPVSGGDIGLNVWVEHDELLVYMGRAGYRDANGALLKPGRVRVKLLPNPFENADFRQALTLREGYVLVTAGEGGTIRMLPAWPEAWDVDFKLHAPYKTTVEGTFRAGEMTSLHVTPKERQDDVLGLGATVAT
ncbi:MAG: hypothetical protein HN700_08885 [Verrucomicrobia bacterium]|nr:hypothetical protein [Verrucomicrobiota bacterium]